MTAKRGAPVAIPARIGRAPGPVFQPPQISGSAITSRPNDGSGYWPDFSNTGYQNYTGAAANPGSAGLTIPCTHGYAGLYDYASGMSATSALAVDSSGPLTLTFGKVHFRGKMSLGDEAACNTMIFNGCVFDGTWPNDNLAQIYLPTLFKCSYTTFRPAEWRGSVNVPQLPPGNNGSVSTSPTYPGTPYLDSWQYLAAFQNSATPGQTGNFRTEMDHCDIWGNAGMELVDGGSQATPCFFESCYIHDQADTDWQTGLAAGLAVDTGTYHQDGIGPESVGPESWINVIGCTIASLGTTNAIAYQGSNGAFNCLIQGCYFAGWELGISLSIVGPSTDYGITFTGNIWSAEIPFVDSPMYSHWSWNSGGTPPAANTQMLWRGNRWQVRSYDPTLTGYWLVCPDSETTCPSTPVGDLVQQPNAPESIGWDATWNGQYWWPSDDNPHAGDYTG